jgi:hypothetical protein
MADTRIFGLFAGNRGVVAWLFDQAFAVPAIFDVSTISSLNQAGFWQGQPELVRNPGRARFGAPQI